MQLTWYNKPSKCLVLIHPNLKVKEIYFKL